MFDTSASQSFISAIYVKMFEFDMRVLDELIYVATLAGKSLIIVCVCKFCKLKIGYFEFMVDSMVLEIANFDVMLGMD